MAEELTKLGQWEGALNEAFKDASAAIAAQMEADAAAEFDLKTKAGLIAAKSHLSKLKKARAALEKQRKESKALALEYGRIVDAKAKDGSAAISSAIDGRAAEIDDHAKALERAAVAVEAAQLPPTAYTCSVSELQALRDQIAAIAEPEAAEAVAASLAAIDGDYMPRAVELQELRQQAAESEEKRKAEAKAEADKVEAAAATAKREAADNLAKAGRVAAAERITAAPVDLISAPAGPQKTGKFVAPTAPAAPAVIDWNKIQAAPTAKSAAVAAVDGLIKHGIEYNTARIVVGLIEAGKIKGLELK